MHVSRLRLIVLAVLATGLVVSCQQSGPPEVTKTPEGVLRLGSVEAVDTVSRTVAPNGRPLIVEGIRGSVHLTGADQSTADLSFVRRGRGDSPEAARSVLQGISVTEQGTDAEYVYTLTADRGDYSAMDVRGQIPREADLRIDRMSGPVRVEAVTGALTIRHAHGPVYVRGAAAPVRIDIDNGDVRVDFQALSPEGPIRIQTDNGDVRVGLPPGASAQIDARTDVGTIRTHGLSLTTERFGPINAGAQYNAQMGAGGPTLELRTQNGSISLQPADTTRADTTVAPPSDPPPILPADTTVVPDGGADTIRSDTAVADTAQSEN